MNRSEILNTAASLVSGDRNVTHGHPGAQLGLCADLWSTYGHVELKGADVAIAMALSKISRMACGKFNIDDYVDACGYIAIAGELAGADPVPSSEQLKIPGLEA